MLHLVKQITLFSCYQDEFYHCSVFGDLVCGKVTFSRTIQRLHPFTGHFFGGHLAVVVPP